MQKISYDEIIAALGVCIWFIFPLGVFISIVRQDHEALPPRQPKENKKTDDHLKIFEHKKMSYNDELEELEILPNDASNIPEEINQQDDDFNHPHAGIGSTHVHHIF